MTNTPTMDSPTAAISERGFALLPTLFSPAECTAILDRLVPALTNARDTSSVLLSRGVVYGTRNLERIWPGVLDVASHPPLVAALESILGVGFGLVRTLFFDKPPEQTWSLPWHKDVHVAVRAATVAGGFKGPTIKAGIPHLEAPVSLLERMLTARIHLDEVTSDNGPLEVRPGTHRVGEPGPPDGGDLAPEVILSPAGGVLLMRPLLDHRSGPSGAGTVRHRRILHLEFASDRALPAGLEWNLFHRSQRHSQPPIHSEER